MTDQQLKRTPLYDTHKNLGGRIVGFAGWELPVRYGEVITEHKTVRESVGLFDVSHMGELWVRGPEAEKFLNYLTCNDLRNISDGQAQYTALTNEQGGIVDDIIIYRYSTEKYMVCVNASNADKDYGWICKHNQFDAEVENASVQFGQIALQGPKAVEVCQAVQADDLTGLKPFHFMESEIAGVPVIAARTGYTGEDGFEFFIPSDGVVPVWERLMAVGQEHGIAPIGLGARDSLRLEACFPLHGHELAEDITAVESGLKRFIRVDQDDFIGKGVIKQQIEEGAPRKRVGFIVKGRGVVREECVLQMDGRDIGVVTSGTMSPTLGQAIGLALVQTDSCGVGAAVQAIVRGRELECEIVKLPFYKRGR